ncbi:hypothetical protein LCGC14_0944910 [marine sediment metagenome]|uniref:Uncharacterized protein n=1 Tax=marine sediment metagenome TaxID=412755 RepID=A0A0F9NNQ7_9ZZZZ
MKTKDVIEMLQKADPSGKLDCVVGNYDIFCAHVEPAYWDGCMQLLVRDKDNSYYNVTGAIYTSKGVKVQIETMGIDDALCEDPELPVEVIDTFVNKRMQDQVDAWRVERKKEL